LFWPDLHPQIRPGLELDLGENYCRAYLYIIVPYLPEPKSTTSQFLYWLIKFVRSFSDKTNHVLSCSVVYVDYASFHKLLEMYKLHLFISRWTHISEFFRQFFVFLFCILIPLVVFVQLLLIKFCLLLFYFRCFFSSS